MPEPPLSNRQLAALRACFLYPQGMRHAAYPKTMPGLQERGFVASRLARGPGRKLPAWFITKAGWDYLATVDGARPRRRRGAAD